MRSLAKLTLVLVLIALPVAARRAWFYRGGYTPPDIPEIDDSQIALSPSEYRPFADEPIESFGRVVIDISHANNLEVDDLTPLWDRLTARGVAIETLDGSGDSLATQLRGATALVVIAPTSKYTAEERDAVVAFVEHGGRLLLAADPTRPVPPEEEEDTLDLNSVFFPTSAIPAINSLASAFGVVYFDDYLYNLVDNQGNYRNVKFTTLNDEHPLTRDLETVVFFAAHSLRSDGLSLISGDENTLSPLRSGETGLTAASLSADSRVLALGDITVFTPAYHTIADNDRFLSNVAGWLASAERRWDLKDFPYLFKGAIDLVQIAEGPLDARLIARSDTLQEVFDQAGLTLNLSATSDLDHDTLFVGTFEDVELVQKILATAGVTITIVEAEEEETGDQDQDETGADEKEPQGSIEIEGMGTLDIKGITLFIVDRSADRVVVVALAGDDETAIGALDRLTSSDFSGCVQGDAVTVCSTGEVQEEPGPGAEDDENGQPSGEGVTPEGPPSIGSLSESEVAFEAQTPWLSSLASESYDITSQAGETYTYTIVMDRSQDVLWVYNWCTATEEQLAQNWDNISLVFTLDGEEVPLDRFVMLEGSFGDVACRMYYALLADWPQGEHALTNEITFAAELDDGFEVYPAGTHVYDYRVTVDQ